MQITPPISSFNKVGKWCPKRGNTSFKKNTKWPHSCWWRVRALERVPEIISFLRCLGAFYIWEGHWTFLYLNFLIYKMGIIIIPTSEVSVRIMSCHVGYLVKGPALPVISLQLKLPLITITIILVLFWGNQN